MNGQPSKFAVRTPVKPTIDPGKLEQFASEAGASTQQPPPQTVGVAPATTDAASSTADRTKGFLLRLTPEQFDRMEQVYKKSTYKSKQTMGEKLLMDAIESLGRELGAPPR